MGRLPSQLANKRLQQHWLQHCPGMGQGVGPPPGAVAVRAFLPWALPGEQQALQGALQGAVPAGSLAGTCRPGAAPSASAAVDVALGMGAPCGGGGGAQQHGALWLGSPAGGHGPGGGRSGGGLCVVLEGVAHALVPLPPGCPAGGGPAALAVPVPRSARVWAGAFQEPRATGDAGGGWTPAAELQVRRLC